MDYDVVIIGAGHNALVSAAYLAQAGYRIGVFEKRNIVGGAVATAEIVPGYQFDLGGSAHILIRLTPIVEELGLTNYGLDYIDLDPLLFSPFPDDDAVFIYRDVERTIDHLNSKFPNQGSAYGRFIEDWRDFARTILELFLTSPSPFQIGKRFMKGGGAHLDWQHALRFIAQPYGEVARYYFEEEKLRTMLVWMAAQSGPPPTEPLTGPFLLWHPLYHEGGMARPRGGSGMLTQALRRHVEAHGGRIFTDMPVDAIQIEGDRATGIRANGQIVTSRAVLSGTHALETLGRLLPASHRPPGLRTLRTGNGFGLMLRLALDAPIEYTAAPGLEARTALQLLCRDTAQIDASYGDYLKREPSNDPPLVAMTFSAVDETLTPPGGEVLWLWGQYFPYRLARDQSWDDIAEQVEDRLLDCFEQYAPGTRGKIVGSLFQHPVWLERELGLYNANVMHLEMSLDQMFMLRPLQGLANYRTHVKGLYLTGASTHPGGGIMGASGRNASRVLLSDLDRRRI